VIEAADDASVDPSNCAYDPMDMLDAMSHDVVVIEVVVEEPAEPVEPFHGSGTEYDLADTQSATYPPAAMVVVETAVFASVDPFRTAYDLTDMPSVIYLALEAAAAAVSVESFGSAHDERNEYDLVDMQFVTHSASLAAVVVEAVVAYVCPFHGAPVTYSASLAAAVVEIAVVASVDLFRGAQAA
jgi:hypothetical protein